MLDDYPRVRACFRRLARRVPALGRVDLAAGRPGQFPAARDFAYTTNETSPIRVVFAPRLEAQQHGRIEGVMRHELAHALLLSRGDASHSEREADALAERLFGRPIWYDDDRVQTIEPGRHRYRPASLPA